MVDVIDADDDEEREAFNLFASSMSNTFLRERGYTSGGSRSPPLFENRCCCRVTTAMVDDVCEVVVLVVALVIGC